MLFLLYRVDRSDPEHPLHSQQGIVIAVSLEAAAEMLDLAIVEVVTPPGYAVVYAVLECGYEIEEFPEITGPVAKESVPAAPSVVDQFIGMVLKQRAAEA
jgi:hypothetical protein